MTSGLSIEYQSGYKINIGDVETISAVPCRHKEKDGDLRTAGGRVLGVTAVKENLDKAREAVYNNIKKINFEGMHYRKDIGIKND